MARRKQTAAEFIDANALYVPFVIGDLMEHLGRAAQQWSQAVYAAREGDLEKALQFVVDVDIDIDIPLKVGRSGLHSITERASRLLDGELPDDDEGDAT